MEQALKSASEDALSETRALARQLFGAYSASWPHRMHDLLQQLSGNVQAKMIQAITAYRPGKHKSPPEVTPTFVNVSVTWR